MFENRKLVISTQHEKEKVIAPILEKFLGVTCVTPTKFNTDMLGSFSGEIPRQDDAITTARKKCLMGMEELGCNLGIASEGSFGMHPSAFFIPANQEVLMFIDRKNNLEITAQVISTETNFSGEEITSLKALHEFCERVKFPSHAIIIKNTKENFNFVEKGINEPNQLEQVFNKCMQQYGKVYAETDMRAMYNPSRMKVIEQATMKLVEQINSRCPACKTPGFSVVRYNPGLPCKICLYPTRSVLSCEYICQKCNHTSMIEFPDNKYHEDPMYCDLCNP
ncbi:MAG: DUF6671 family protein [Bacteroidia bacterium]